MGTNFYIRTQPSCPTCKRPYEKIHLGKSSMGWPFLLQWNGGEFYTNWEEMKEWLKGKKIKNEYDEKVSRKQFIQWVESRKDTEEPQQVDYGEGYYVIDGYRFWDCQFS